MSTTDRQNRAIGINYDYHNHSDKLLEMYDHKIELIVSTTNTIDECA